MLLKMWKKIGSATRRMYALVALLTFFLASFLTMAFFSAFRGVKMASLDATETSSLWGCINEAFGGSKAGDPMGDLHPRSSSVDPRWPRIDIFFSVQLGVNFYKVGELGDQGSKQQPESRHNDKPRWV